MNYNERLMPCPFCGGEANMITTTNGSTHHDVSFTFEVECSECGTSLPWVHELRVTLENGELKITKDERDRAVEEWNRRMQKKKARKNDGKTKKKHHRNHTAEKSNRQRRVAVYAISRQYTKRQERMEKNPLPDLRRYVLEETGRRSSYSL